MLVTGTAGTGKAGITSHFVDAASATRPTTLGLEMHLVKMRAIIEDVKPKIVVMDPLHRS